MKKYIDLIGKKFNSLTIIGAEQKEKQNRWYLICKCDCGREKSIRANRVLSGEKKTCGCLNKGYANGFKHNLSHKYPKLYSVWNAIRHRCYDPNNHKYKDYGNRGITVCEEWRNDFKVFYDWAIANGYKEDLTIDRIDNNGNYEPFNCRWVTQKEQQRNRRSNRYITYKGETKCLAQWCEDLNLPYDIIRGRIYSLKWSIEKTFETPPKFKKSK